MTRHRITIIGRAHQTASHRPDRSHDWAVWDDSYRPFPARTALAPIPWIIAALGVFAGVWSMLP